MSNGATFAELIGARARGEAVFAIEPGREHALTYAGLARDTQRIGALLDERGVVPGDVVGFMLPNGLAALQVFLGTMGAGRVVLPFNLLAQHTHLDHILADAAPRVVFSVDPHAARLAAAAKRVKSSTRVERWPADAGERSPRFASLAAPRGGAASRLGRPGATDITTPPVDRAAHDIAMLMYTSGTTGMPKGVELTHANMLVAGRAVQAHQSLSPDDRVLSSLPLYHINGQCIAVVSTLVSGGSLVLPERFSTSQWWSLVERYRPTWLNLVPTIVAYLLNGPDPTPSQREAMRYVRYARSASAPLPPDQHEAFEARFGIPIVEAMGLTECASVAFCNPMDRSLRRIGSAGQPLAVEARVVDRVRRPLADGETGEIEIAGPNVMRGYHKAEAATAATLKDGWLATGDLGYRDADGFYFITGRLKELIIKGGENIAPREIDEALLKHAAVLEAAAVGVPDREYGQEILACVVVKPAMHVDETELETHCLRELGRFKSPRYFRFVDELPKGPSGKVQRMKLVDGWGK
ncbi:MAG TPA: AMP-binding protein [Casimicrobiaceae bacterium]|nr:AMP-binding protein [Casimicrobiaceae bacterium]